MDGSKEIVLGGGCFWCTEACLVLVDGVLRATAGYAGGATENPTYEQVSSGGTGHAEVVEVEYDPSVVGLEEILDVFFASHDPTSLNRQGADVGTQYRSIVLCADQEQRAVVESYISRLQRSYSRPVVTEVAELERFYPAEEHHQQYYARNPGQGYCRVVIAPKVEKLRGRQGDP